MSSFTVLKLASEEFDIAIEYINKNPNIVYEISDYVSITAVNRRTDDDVADDLIDLDKSNFIGATAFPWIKKDFGTVGDRFDLVVTCRMTTGQELSKSVEVVIVDRI